jgi:hypothetical protein
MTLLGLKILWLTVFEPFHTSEKNREFSEVGFNRAATKLMANFRPLKGLTKRPEPTLAGNFL